MMFGQMTAGSWIYIGSQGIVQGTYETFVELGRQHYGGDLSGRWILTAGLGGMGGAQPLAAKMAGASLLAIECQTDRIEKRIASGYLDTRADTVDEALSLIEESVRARTPRSVGLLGNAAEILPELLARGVRPDALTDQTSAHDPANGYLPAGWSVEEWHARRASDPDAVAAAAVRSIADHVRAMLGFHDAGVPTFDYGNNIRQEALGGGVDRAFDFPGFVPAYIRPSFAGGSDRFAGRRFREIPKTSTAPTPGSRNSSPTIPISTIGWIRLGRTSSFRGSRRASAGWDWGNATDSASRSTRWSARENSKPPSSSAAITSTVDRSRAPTAKPRPCATAPTRYRTGRS